MFPRKTHAVLTPPQKVKLRPHTILESVSSPLLSFFKPPYFVTPFVTPIVTPIQKMGVFLYIYD